MLSQLLRRLPNTPEIETEAGRPLCAQMVWKYCWQRATARREPATDGGTPVFLWVPEDAPLGDYGELIKKLESGQQAFHTFGDVSVILIRAGGMFTLRAKSDNLPRNSHPAGAQV
jgi:hypothetical protein